MSDRHLLSPAPSHQHPLVAGCRLTLDCGYAVFFFTFLKRCLARCVLLICVRAPRLALSADNTTRTAVAFSPASTISFLFRSRRPLFYYCCVAFSVMLRICPPPPSFSIPEIFRYRIDRLSLASPVFLWRVLLVLAHPSIKSLFARGAVPLRGNEKRLLPPPPRPNRYSPRWLSRDTSDPLFFFCFLRDCLCTHGAAPPSGPRRMPMPLAQERGSRARVRMEPVGATRRNSPSQRSSRVVPSTALFSLAQNSAETTVPR